jgi:hypothetical protein
LNLPNRELIAHISAVKNSLQRHAIKSAPFGQVDASHLDIKISNALIFSQLAAKLVELICAVDKVNLASPQPGQLF